MTLAHRNFAAQVCAGSNVRVIGDNCVMAQQRKRVYHHVGAHADIRAHNRQCTDYSAFAQQSARRDDRRRVHSRDERFAGGAQLVKEDAAQGIVTHAHNHAIMIDVRQIGAAAKHRQPQAQAALRARIIVHIAYGCNGAARCLHGKQHICHHLTMAACAQYDNLHAFLPAVGAN